MEKGQPINVCVPTGNFGNILSAYYAKQMGVPIHKLICASNQNNVLTDFIKTGVYDRNRPFYNTMSPSMDILISSNLERMLFEFTERDDVAVKEYMSALAAEGRYEVSEKVKKQLDKTFAAGCCGDAETQAMIAKMWKEKGYLIDTHTAVAFHVLEEYRRETGDDTPALVASTASPFQVLRQRAGRPGCDRPGFRHRHPGSALPGHRRPGARPSGRTEGKDRPVRSGHREGGHGRPGAGDAPVTVRRR